MNTSTNTAAAPVNVVTFAGVEIKTSKTGRMLLLSLAKALRGPLAALVTCRHESAFDGMIDGSAPVVDGDMTAAQMADAVQACAGRSHGGGCYITDDGAIRVYNYCDTYSIRIKGTERPAPAAPVKAAPVAPAINLSATKDIPADCVPFVRFASLNKNNTLAEYQREIDACRFEYVMVRVSEVVTMTAAAFDELTESFLTDRAIFAGKGGIDTLPSGERVRVCLLVVAPGRPSLYIDPQGYSYARYVGI